MIAVVERASREGVQRHLERLLEIDEDTIGEEWERDHFLIDLPGKWSCSWLALDGGTPIGFVISSMKDESVHVHRIAVNGRERGRGVGRILLNRVARSARELGKPWITLRVARRNELAVRFYDRLGFEVDDPDAELLDLRIRAHLLDDSARIP